MRIAEIDIDRFRIWRSLLLRLDTEGLNVIYGPNEAGKTTLMNFVRSVLYGFQPLDEEPAWHSPEDDIPWKGALRCRHSDKLWRVSRRAHATHGGTLRITGAPDDLSKEEALSLLLGDTKESVFSDVFALGVRELHELSTLGSDQVAQYIYGLSLGHQGRQLLQAISDIRQRKAALISPDGTQGRLAELFDTYSELAAKSGRDGETREKHARLTRERSDLEARIQELQQRESQIEGELKGLRFISACYTPWKRTRDLNEQLAALPVVRHSPSEALQQLAACESDIRTHSSRREKLAEQADQLRQQANRLKLDLLFDKNRYAIQSLAEQADWLRTIDGRIRLAEDRSQELKQNLHRQLAEMGDDWSVERLDAIDTSPAAHHQLLQTARKYQDALQRRAKLRKWNRGLSRKSSQELVELDSDMLAYNIESVPDAIQREKERLTELEDFGRLRLQREQLALKIQTVRKVMSRVNTHDTIPPWVDRAVMGITAVAVALFFFGMITYGLGAAGTQSLGGALAASAFAFAGMMWWGIRNGMRNYFDRKTGIQLDDLNGESRQAEQRLRGVQERIRRIQADGIAGQHLLKADAKGSSTAHLVECMGECTRNITDLERLNRRQERAAARRRRLGILRERYRASQQKVNEHRQEWCRLLTSLGMDETVKVREAFDWWQTIQEVRELQTQWRNSAPEVEGLRRMFDGTAARVRQLGQLVAPNSKLTFDRPLEVLTAWQQQLKTHDRDRLERERLTQEAEDKAHDASMAQHQIEAAELRRDAVLARCGVLNVDELTQQQEWVRKREEAEGLLKIAVQELNDVAFAEPELAVVEDDLNRFDAKTGRETIQRLEAEQEDVEKELNAAHETVGSLKQQILLLESSRGSQQEYFRRAQLAFDIHRAGEEWYALQYEEDVVGRMREHFERENISGTLRMASSYLHRMTAGRYHKIWAPLGEDYLCVDDEYSRTFRVEQLSGGTREQLFLALRFALAREFAERGIELPMVMDDLFVNFDQERTDLAMECLLELGESGQQILFFTCHRHLAEHFSNKGVQTLWLPGHRIGTDLNRPEDEAAAFLEDGPQSARMDAPESALTGRQTASHTTVALPDADDILEDEAG